MRRNKLAIVALLMGIVSFINLLGIEKGVMAIIIGWTALQEVDQEPEKGGRGLAWTGIGLGMASIVLIVVLVFTMGPKIMRFFNSLR